MAPRSTKGLVPDYPILFKHMALAIYRTGSLKGPPADRFQSALEIALAQLRKYQMATSGSSLARVELTSYGFQTNQKHKREPSSGAKTRLFDAYYKSLASEGESNPPNPVVLRKAASRGAPPKSKSKSLANPVSPQNKKAAPRKNAISPRKPNTAPRVPKAKRVTRAARAKRA